MNNINTQPLLIVITKHFSCDGDFDTPWCVFLEQPTDEVVYNSALDVTLSLDWCDLLTCAVPTIDVSIDISTAVEIGFQCM